MRKPSIPPAGPPRESQSSIRTTQPTPIIVPKPKVKYSTVLSPPRRRATRALYLSSTRELGRPGRHEGATPGRSASCFVLSWLECRPVGHQPRRSFASPRFAQPATFMRLPHVEDAHGLDVALVGVPFDGGTSYRPGARLAPREIRAQSSLIRSYSYFQ